MNLSLETSMLHSEWSMHQPNGLRSVWVNAVVRGIARRVVRLAVQSSCLHVEGGLFEFLQMFFIGKCFNLKRQRCLDFNRGLKQSTV